MANTSGKLLPDTLSTTWLRIAWPAVLVAAFLLLSANLIFGNLNQDEGWYLYAAGLIHSGNMPYRDFAFTQGPVMPYIYALAASMFQEGGLAAGRLLTALFALAGACLATLLARRLAPPACKPIASLLCFTLILVNVYQTYFCTMVKTYSLTILLLVGAVLAMHIAITKRKSLILMLSAALFVAAAGTRSSAAVVLPIAFVSLWLDRKRLFHAAWFHFLLGSIVAAGIVFGPFLSCCFENFYYFVVRYHTLRHEGGFLASLIFKAGFVSRLLQAYFVCLTLWAAALAAKWLRNKWALTDQPSDTPVESALTLRIVWLSVVAVSIVHFCAPFPYDDYQVFIYPFAAIGVAVMLAGQFRGKSAVALLVTAIGLSMASSISSPINQDWFIEGRELIWWRSKDHPPLLKLRQTAGIIRGLCIPGDTLLTQDPYLAVESGLSLPHGLEMGQFSYFPDLTREQALKLNVLNRDLLLELLSRDPSPIAAISGYAFAMQSPGILKITDQDKNAFSSIITNRYDYFATIPDFGQASTPLRLYRKKTNQGQ